MKVNWFYLAAVFLFGLAAAGCSSVARAEAMSAPEAVVADFYEWYLSYCGTPGADDFRSPLSDQAYHDSQYLSPVFVQQVDDLLASFNGAGYDPFLCAQDTPKYMNVVETHVSDGEASARVETSFINHQFTVELDQTDGEWLIVDILCQFE